MINNLYLRRCGGPSVIRSRTGSVSGIPGPITSPVPAPCWVCRTHTFAAGNVSERESTRTTRYFRGQNLLDKPPCLLIKAGGRHLSSVLRISTMTPVAAVPRRSALWVLEANAVTALRTATASYHDVRGAIRGLAFHWTDVVADNGVENGHTGVEPGGDRGYRRPTPNSGWFVGCMDPDASTPRKWRANG